MVVLTRVLGPGARRSRRESGWLGWSVGWARAAGWALAGLALVSCAPEIGEGAVDRLDLPTGLAASPEGRWLFVSNGNWDAGERRSGIVALDLEALEAGLDRAGPAGGELSEARPCRAHAADDRLECDDRLLIDARLGVRIPSGAGNIAIDRPGGLDGPLRLLIPTRLEPGLAWIDVFGPGFGGGPELRFECGQAEDQRCDRVHLLAGVPPDPARIRVDSQGFRYAYLPHLLGRRLTLLALDGDRGPEVVDVEEEFFRVDELFDSGLGGGFAVAQRACSVEDDNAPAVTLECTRPFLFASQRFWWGLRGCRVAPGLDLRRAGGEPTVLGPNLEAADPRPLIGGLVYEDPERGERLLVVHTTPPALSRVDTSLDENRDPRATVVNTVSLCGNPNVVVVHRPGEGEPGSDLALVSCYGSDQVAVVDLGVFTVVQTIDVGDGPNELLVDGERRWLIVANTAESSLSLIDLDPRRPSYLREFATVGLGTPARRR